MKNDNIIINISTFLTLRLHNVSPVTIKHLTLSECIKRINEFRHPDNNILKLMNILFTNRQLKRRKIILDNKMLIEYENGDVVEIDYNTLSNMLNLNMNLKDTLAIITFIVGGNQNRIRKNPHFRGDV